MTLLTKEKYIMLPVIINYDRCNADGICTEVCPRKLIKFNDEGSKPRLTPEAAALCINCGHCLSACPAGAISLNGIASEDCAETVNSRWPGNDELDLFLRSRRSIRVYKEKPVDREMLKRLLDTCRYAPSGSNQQPVNWIIATDKEQIQMLGQLVIDWMKDTVKSKQTIAPQWPLASLIQKWEDGEDVIFRNAPLVIITHAHETSSLPTESCVIAMTYFDLLATSMGLGTCWVGFLMTAASLYAPIREVLDMPHGHKLYGAMVAGYPKYTYKKIPERNRTKVIWW
jgi:nitroreductase/NAD-dependent dihydropyrimidine dehydrogenase PreA subunit